MSLIVQRDTAAGNIWQVGAPHKTKFNTAATTPNVIITDTVNNYPRNDSSRFSLKFKDSVFGFGSNLVIAVRWKQKLDMQKKHAGGIVEFSKNGSAWQNIFNNSAVYNFYGYLQGNKDTLLNGAYAFSGTDTVWRDVWLCFRNASVSDSMSVRFTLKSDTSGVWGEGWMLDNMLVQRTQVHTVSAVETGHEAKVYPTETGGILFIEAAHLSQQHYIRAIQITDATGKVVQSYNDEQQRFMLDLGSLPSATYFVKVTTNLGAETFPVVLRH